MNKSAELRRVNVREMRVKQDEGGKAMLFGHAAVFGTETVIWDFVEKIEPGAFAETIQIDDIRCLKNHNDDFVLGRSKPGADNNTLRLAEDETGLAFEVDPPDIGWANDLLVSIERGDVTGCSFGFYVLDDDWHYNAQGTLVRTIKKAQVFEVSVGVTFPAYETTDVAVKRSIDDLQARAVEMRKKLGSASDPQTRSVESGNVALLKMKAKVLGL